MAINLEEGKLNSNLLSCLKIDLVTHPVQAEGLGKYIYIANSNIYIYIYIYIYKVRIDG